ncbi:MAG: carboxymuconolactone decarboxylase family protein [Burkholderiaceae bacterium]|nr:carboxymuconolactone decarboxylase family protein [Burkholderiaceae bacterium]
MTVPRIPYVPEDLAEPADVVAAVRARRGGGLIELDRMLLHSPPLAEGWNHFLNNVRTRLIVPARLRELAMCVVAVLNRAEYEFVQHAPLLIETGATQAQVDALADPAAAAAAALFTPVEQAVIRLTIEMTRDIDVQDTTFAALREHLDEQQSVEIVGTIAAYNMVSRFLVALGVHPS